MRPAPDQIQGAGEDRRFESKDREARAQRTGQGDAATQGPRPPSSGSLSVPSIAMTAPRPIDDEEESRWAALAARDARADGGFVYSVRTTGVYCRPSCPARTARPENVAFHATCAEGRGRGLPTVPALPPERADARSAPGRGGWRAPAARSMRPRRPRPSTRLAKEAGMSAFHFHRVFKAATGVTPKAYADARRAERLAAGLREGHSVTEAVYEAGYGTASRFYAGAAGRLGMAPGGLPQGRGRRAPPIRGRRLFAGLNPGRGDRQGRSARSCSGTIPSCLSATSRTGSRGPRSSGATPPSRAGWRG